jgi:hypothetical protein
VEYVVSQISLVAILLLMLGAPGIALPCNPVIDGTYCATNSRRDISTSPTRFEPIRNIGDEARPVGTILRQIKASPMAPDMNFQYDQQNWHRRRAPEHGSR